MEINRSEACRLRASDKTVMTYTAFPMAKWKLDGNDNKEILERMSRCISIYKRIVASYQGDSYHATFHDGTMINIKK